MINSERKCPHEYGERAYALGCLTFYTFFEFGLATFFSDDPTHSDYPDFFSEFFEHRYIPSLGLKDSSDLRK